MSPHAQPRGIDKLQLEIVHGTATSQPKTNGVILVHRTVRDTSCHHEAAAVTEVEIHPQRGLISPRHRGQRELRIANGHRHPSGYVGKEV